MNLAFPASGSWATSNLMRQEDFPRRVILPLMIVPLARAGLLVEFLPQFVAFLKGFLQFTPKGLAQIVEMLGKLARGRRPRMIHLGEIPIRN